MYQWLVFLHILGVFGFLLAHGGSFNVAFRLRRESDPQALRALLELSNSNFGLMYLSLLVLLISGIIAGFMGKWWQHGWIWVSLGTLLALTFAMYITGSTRLSRIRKVIGLPYYERGKPQPAQDPAGIEEIQAEVAAWNPHLTTTLGVIGLGVILWLMVLKPF